MNLQKTDGVNFGASIKFELAQKGGKVSKERLAKLAKTFEERTAKQYPNDKFVLSATKEGADLYGDSKNFYLNDEIGSFSSKGLKELFELTDIQITDKFKKLFGILKGKQAERTNYNKLCKQLGSKGADTEALDDAFFAATKEATEEALYKDSVLRDFTTAR